jgi:hypothetical protein
MTEQFLWNGASRPVLWCHPTQIGELARFRYDLEESLDCRVNFPASYSWLI